MSFKILKNIGFLLKQQIDRYIYLMLLASSLAFASETKGGVCQTSFSHPESSESRTASSAEKDLAVQQKISFDAESTRNLDNTPESSEVRTSNNKTEKAFDTPESSEIRETLSVEQQISDLDNSELPTDLDTELRQQIISAPPELKRQILSMLENPELPKDSNLEQQITSNFDTSENSEVQKNLASSSVEENTSQTKPEAFPPLYRLSSNLWKVPSQQDPITKKNLQEIFWNLVYESSNKNYSASRFEDDLQVLIRNGVDIYAKDERGWTALDHAVNNENHNLVTALTDISERSVRGGYRSFMKSKFGTLSMTEGYSVSDYKRALRIAKKNRQTAMENRQEERVTHSFETGDTIELSRFNINEKEQVNEEIIDTLKWYLSYERKNRFFQATLLGFFGGITLFVTGFFL